MIEADTRGHGRSTRGTAVPTYAQIADDARHIVQALGLDEYHVFGFSDGGIAVYRLAARDERVQSVITVCASWHSRQLEPVREMFENLTPAFFRENMARQVAVYEALNPHPTWIRSPPTCAACGWTYRPAAIRTNASPPSKRPCWPCAANAMACFHCRTWLICIPACPKRI